MPNSFCLNGDWSRTQSALVLPQGDSNLYYIFTMNIPTEEFEINYSFNYSMVDFNLDGVLGDGFTKNKNLRDFCYCCLKKNV